MSLRRIGLLGGSFNPAHEGHLHLTLTSLKSLRLSEAWWLVSPQNPLKSTSCMAEYQDRFASAERLARHPRIKVSGIERALGTRYSIDTVKALKQRYPRVRFVWLMGADNLANFHRWRRWREMLREIPIVVFDRAPFSHTALRAKAPLSFAKFRLPEGRIEAVFRRRPPAWGFVYMRKHAASSTFIRKILGKNAFLAHNNS